MLEWSTHHTWNLNVPGENLRKHFHFFSLLKPGVLFVRANQNITAQAFFCTIKLTYCLQSLSDNYLIIFLITSLSNGFILIKKNLEIKYPQKLCRYLRDKIQFDWFLYNSQSVSQNRTKLLCEKKLNHFITLFSSTCVLT